MMSLILEPNFNEPGKRYFRDFSPGDDFYQELIDMHRSERITKRDAERQADLDSCQSYR